MRLETKVALISGGARGQGAAEARMFAREGAKVVIADILDEDGRKVEAEINELGGQCVYVHLDVTSETEWRDAVASAVGRFGKLNILVNNAGIFKQATVEDTSETLWDEIMDINAKGVFLGTRAAIPEMRRAGGGSIINISSVAGLIGSAYSGAYGSSKGAVRLFTKATAIQYALGGCVCGRHAVSHQPSSGRYVDDGATTGPSHRRDNRFGTEENPFGIDLHDLVPQGFRGLFNRFCPVDARVIY